MLSDPRKKTDLFACLLDDIRQCKAAKTCPNLKIRQYYFEPNPFTISAWKQKNLYKKDIDRRLIFVCESPGPSAPKNSLKSIEPCFFSSPRDARFEETRRKYGFENCYITNTVKCGVRFSSKHNQSEVVACRGFLVREIEFINPQVLVGVGANAYRTLRTDTLAHIKNPPVLFQVTHYSSRRNPHKSWESEFQELLRLLSKLST
jgi:hypothetical protein